MHYSPGIFASLYASSLGKKIWSFLNEPENILRMKTATTLERPAVEGIEDQLLQEFKEAILNDRVKQMVGHMVRQIMENCGYVVAVQNVKVTNGAPFSRATRYKKRDEMTYHVWKRTSNARSLALTADKTVSRLPGDKKAWIYWKSFRGALRGLIAFDLKDDAAARAAIVQQGCYTYEMKRLLKAP